MTSQFLKRMKKDNNRQQILVCINASHICSDFLNHENRQQNRTSSKNKKVKNDNNRQQIPDYITTSHICFKFPQS